LQSVIQNVINWLSTSHSLDFSTCIHTVYGIRNDNAQTWTRASSRRV